MELIGLSVQKKFKINFQHGGHTGFPLKTNVTILDVQVTQMLPTKFRVNWPFGLGEEMQYIFLK